MKAKAIGISAGAAAIGTLAFLALFGAGMNPMVQLACQQIGEIHEATVVPANPWSNANPPDSPGWWRFRNLPNNTQRNISEVVYWQGDLVAIFGPNTRLYIADLDEDWEYGGKVTIWPED